MLLLQLKCFCGAVVVLGVMPGLALAVVVVMQQEQ
jgi:hypothetical protein